MLDSMSLLVRLGPVEAQDVNEQPFTRSGGPVDIDPDAVVVVRAHMQPGGYGGRAMRGTVGGGFQVWDSGADFALALENVPPQPPDCGF